MLTHTPDRTTCRALLVAALMARPAGPVWRHDPNRPLLAQLIAGRHLEEGCLPPDLGLGQAAFQSLMRHYFPGPCLTMPAPAIRHQRNEMPEHDDLLQLLLAHRSRNSPSELWMATMLVTACLGSDHLWQDLGLGNREQLSRLLYGNFQALARHNVGDMKWKKFLYKQLCEQEGIYVCPAPSCQTCTDHPKCFSPEV